MKKIILTLICVVAVAPTTFISAQNADVNPLDLEFQRLSVRRFIFSENINLCEFVPSEIVSFASMHPAFALAEENKPLCDIAFIPQLKAGKLILSASSGKTPACFYVGSVNPYATYDLNIESIQTSETESAEVGIDLARYGLRDRIQFIVKSSVKEKGIFMRIYKDAKLEKEKQYTDFLPEAPFKLRAQLYGRTMGIFTEKNGVTTYHSHMDETPYAADNEHFGDVLDFRKTDTHRECSFNLVSNLQGTVIVGGARSYLSAGMGQADIRLISYEDLSPCLDEGRLWFTFSARGIGIPHPSQGVFSLDPSVFDIRFEGIIVFDFGDGYLRNEVGTQLFYDRNVKEWRAYSCDFGGSANREGRSESQLLTAVSKKDPRRGYSVMQAKLITNDKLAGHHEDPHIFYDASVKKWRLLTATFVPTVGISSMMFESDKWDGKFKEIQPPIALNSTGTTIQEIGGRHYVFMGGANSNLRIHSYPDLKFLGELKLDLQPHWPKPAGRIWANVVPLPEGYPYRYVLLTMDRANFPGITKPTWSYGALYYYGANP
ncbi:MAG: hypothetical protein LBT78_05480 [Tannerella sp.]|jgi:hypothetical protein|nr:hypothetical protein [Tannerella sp.]